MEERTMEEIMKIYNIDTIEYFIENDKIDMKPLYYNNQ